MSALRYVEPVPGFGCYIPGDGSGDGQGGSTEIGFIHTEIFDEDCYLGGLTLPPRPLVVDVGANVGLFTLQVAQRYPGARIVAVEPMPGTFAALCANLDEHGVTGVTPLRRALGARAEPEVVFTYFADLPGNSTRYPEQKADAATRADAHRLFADRREVRMPVERLSDVLADLALPGPIDLLKVDVEGAEADVLAGLDDADWARIGQVVLEVQDFADAPRRVRALLAAHGFRVTARRADGVLGTLGTETLVAGR